MIHILDTFTIFLDLPYFVFIALFFIFMIKYLIHLSFILGYGIT